MPFLNIDRQDSYRTKRSAWNTRRQRPQHPGGGVGSNPMTDVSHTDSICRPKDTDVHIYHTVPGRRFSSSLHCVSLPLSLRFRQKWRYNSRRTPCTTRHWHWDLKLIGSHLETFVLDDAWLLFFSEKVNFMADPHRKYVCRSDVALVDKHSFWVPFLFSGGTQWYECFNTKIDVGTAIGVTCQHEALLNYCAN